MIVKERRKPLMILKLHALLDRISPHHPEIPKIKEELKKREAGYRGETSLDYPLSFLDEKNYLIFHDLRLKDNSSFFQIDTLLLTKSHFIILEVKNISGTLYFDHDFKQLIQTTHNGKERAYSYPLTQLRRQEQQLKRWLEKHRIKQMPITSYVVVSNPQSIIRTSKKSLHISKQVIHKEELPEKLLQLEKSKPSVTLNPKELKKVSRSLLKHHLELEQSIFEKFQLTKNDIQKGVICSSCKYIGMERYHGYWGCPVCKMKSKQAHLQAINEYRILFNSTITNSQLREFLNLQSADTAKRLLKSMNIPYVGENKGRKYDLTKIREF